MLERLFTVARFDFRRLGGKQLWRLLNRAGALLVSSIIQIIGAHALERLQLVL